MRLAALLCAALLVLASLAGQVLAQEPPPAAPPPHPLADQLAELLAVLLASACAALVATARGWLRARLQRDVVIAGVEEAGDERTKAAVHARAEAAGVEPALNAAVQRATARLEKGGAA